jgi:RNA polymerase sigma factor (sigma-70 family)
VLSVCRRVLGHLQDAEDAFQATFLTLASRAAKIKHGVALPSWLHRVAMRIARTLQRANAQRQEHMTSNELENQRLPAPNERLDLKLMLDDELDCLPAKYKSAILLCDYCGYSRKDAAAALKVPIGTLLTNLKRGRERLKQRLLRCGVAVSAIGVASALAQTASAAASVPAELVHSTARLSLLFLAGQTATKAAAPATAVHLAQSTIRRMTMMKLLSMSVLCIAVGAFAIAVPELAQTNLLRAQTFSFFVDDFEDGNVTDGMPVTWNQFLSDGSIEVVAGNFVLSGSDVTAYPEGSNVFTDVTIRTHLRFIQSSSDLFGYVFARSPSDVPASYFAGITRAGVLAIGEGHVDGTFSILATANSAIDPVANDVAIKFAVVGETLSLTAWRDGEAIPPQPQVVAMDDTLSFGEVGVGIGQGADISQVAFRSFAAIPEPATWCIAAVGLASLGTFVLLRRRRIG